ncbi:hypothetical protein Tco_0173407 [Tanacetum coccineum]
MQALKESKKISRRQPGTGDASTQESKKISRRQPGTRGSSEGTGRISRVPDESTVILATLSEGTSTKPGVLDEEKVTSEANVILEWGSKQESEYSKEGDDDEMIEWVDTYEEEEKKDDDDDKSINLKRQKNKNFVHGDEQVNDDEDEETTNAEVEEFGNGDAKITDAAKADAEKTEEVKDDTKKAEFPPSNSRLSVSSRFGDQILKLSYDTSLIDIPQIQSSSPLTYTVSVIFEHSNPHTYTLNSSEAPVNNTSTPNPHVSSNTSQSSLKAAESLSEYELKIIIFENIDKSCSYLTHEKHQALFDALLNSMSLDHAIARGQVDPKKVLKKRDRDDEDPSAGPNQGKPPAKTSKSGKSVTVEELVEEPVFEMAFDDIEQTINDVVTDADQIPDDST